MPSTSDFEPALGPTIADDDRAPTPEESAFTTLYTAWIARHAGPRGHRPGYPARAVRGVVSAWGGVWAEGGAGGVDAGADQSVNLTTVKRINTYS